ncbi:MAG TPA: glycosyltransferase family 2 protein [Candidatus Limnocylindrales bacterium]|nr:glycosyltransferase family 2 protein [Candidatus Limnocylindrales bacterium]
MNATESAGKSDTPTEGPLANPSAVNTSVTNRFYAPAFPQSPEREVSTHSAQRMIQFLAEPEGPACLSFKIRNSEAPEVSVVMPCLNEADTLRQCLRKAWLALAQAGIESEIIVADNGSTDASLAIAEEHGARIIRVEKKGYGSALMAGIESARGKYVIMGDADDSYDFSEIAKFAARLRESNDLVQGCRLPCGGGRIEPHAMPFLHRWLGNPMFSLLVRRMFGAPVHDVYCGLRGFTKEAYGKLNQRCTGMEFATEMIIKASLHKMKIAEVPITLYPDGRKSHAPHLKTFRDGWRTLRFFFLCKPRWLFVFPGLLALVVGLMGYSLAMPGLKIGTATLDAHTLLFSSLAILIGHQCLCFAIYAKVFSCREGLLPPDARVDRFFRFFTLEKGLLLSGLAVTGGLALLCGVTATWALGGFGPLDYAHTMRFVIPGVTLVTLGVQTILSSLMISIMSLAAKN